MRYFHGAFFTIRPIVLSFSRPIKTLGKLAILNMARMHEVGKTQQKASFLYMTNYYVTF